MKPDLGKALAGWLTEQMRDPFLPAYLDHIKEHRHQTAEAALKLGDTDSLKGEVTALDWVLNIAESIMADTEAETGEA